jgi:lipopolysaccharide export system ATP-binding protein
MLLETHGLVKKYSGRTVVNEVNITVGQRSIVGLLGRNGAGKTTSFRMCIGMIVPDGGTVYFEGRDITKLPMYKRARLGMGYLSQEICWPFWRRWPSAAANANARPPTSSSGSA